MSNHNDPALGESLSRSGKYAPTADINGRAHPGAGRTPRRPRTTAPPDRTGMRELADEFGYWPATTDETNGRAPRSQKSRADPSSVRR